MSDTPAKQSAWVTTWIDSVADGSATMSQRSLSTIATRGGGLAAVKKAARSRGVHLLLLKDDRGRAVVAASRDAFKVVC